VAIIFDEIARAFSEIARITVSTGVNDPTPAQEFQWKGQTYDAVLITRISGTLWGPGGNADDSNLTVTVERSKFSGGPIPEPDDYVTFELDKFIIDIVKPSPDGSGVVISAHSMNRAAGIKEREM